MEKKDTQNINLGGYDKNAFSDGTAVSSLENLFYKSCILVPHFKSEDKTPNFDGYFELLEPGNAKSTPIGRYEVQIKSLGHDYQNTNRDASSDYKYSCDTKAMNGVLRGITLNPVILFLVDIHTQAVYYIYLSFEYCMGLGIGSRKNKTIYFSDLDRIYDIQEFYDKLRTTYEEQRDKLRNPNQMGYVLPDNIKVPDEVRRGFEYLNNIMDRELNFIKRSLFPDVWKFGIAYLPDDHDGEITSGQMGIFFIKKGDNGTFLREFRYDEEYPFMFLFHGRTIDELIKEKIRDFIKIYFRKRFYSLSMLPNLALREIVFKQVDRHVFFKQASNAKGKKGKKKVYHLVYRSERIEYDEAVRVISDQTYTENADAADDTYALACAELLKDRGHSGIDRVWACSYESIGIKFKHGISFKPIQKQKYLDRDNASRLQAGAEDFYRQMISLADKDSRRMLESDLSYVAITDDNNTIHSIYKFRSDHFAIRFIKDDSPEAEKYLNMLCTPQPHDGENAKPVGMSSFLPDLIDYSWENIWRSYVESRCLHLIGDKTSFSTLLMKI